MREFKKKIKIISTLLITVFAVTGILSCASQKAQLSIAIGGAPSEIDFWEKVIADFEKSHNTKVKILRGPTDTEQRKQSLIVPLEAKKKDPDVFLMDIAWIAQFAASGYLLPLDQYLDKNFVSRFFQSVVKESDMYRGKLIALPVYIDAGLLYYRKDLLEKYGYQVPETWEELVEQATSIQKSERKNIPDFYGFVWQGAQYEGLVCNFIEFVYSNGGEILDKNGNFHLTGWRAVEALRFMSNLIDVYKISPPSTYTEMKEEEVRMYFQRGKALFERNWPYAWKLHESPDSPVKGKTAVALLPKFSKKTSDHKPRHVATLGGWHIGISIWTDAKEESIELIKYILSYETQKKFATNLGWNPGRKDLYSDPDLKKMLPHIDVLKKAFEHAVARPTLPYYSQISQVLQKYVNMAISGKMDPKEALQEAEKECNSIKERYQNL